MMVPTSPAASRRAEIPPMKRVVIIEEGQHVRISAADVRTFVVGEKFNSCVEIKQ